jgi:hypothetical protein
MKALITRNKSDGIFLAIIIAGLAGLLSTGYWWPEIVLPFGLGLAAKQFLRGRKFDVNVTLIVFAGIYLTSKFTIKWETLMPILLGTGGCFLIFREYFFLRESTEVKEEEELNLEIEEGKDS